MPETTPTPPPEPPSAPSPKPKSRHRRKAAAVALIACAAGFFWWSRSERGEKSARADTHSANGPSRPSALQVDVVTPSKGGVIRQTMQPGTIHAFESVDLFAKVSGFLKEQSVDIGSKVKAGDVLAVLDVPESQIDITAAEAAVAQAKALEVQAQAKVRTSIAERDAVAAEAAQAKAELERLKARRLLSQKQYDRIAALSSRNAVDERLVDEQQHDLDAAKAGEHAGKAAIGTAEAQRIAADARVKQAQADAEGAKAAVQVAAAHLDRAKALGDYVRIHAPFDGVVVKRNLHPGAFVRSAADGGAVPLLTVMRTDLMRVAVQVPDLDVPLLDVGDAVTLVIDAIKGEPIKSTIARISSAEDPQTRTMRAEIDIPNPTGKIVEGMFGRATIELQPPTGNLTLPARCIVQHSGKDKAFVFAARDGKAARVPVTIGGDDGSRVEVLSGLGPGDPIIVNPPGSLADGDAISETRISADGPRKS